MFRAVDEVGATLNTALVVMGDRLGLYRAMAGAGPLTPTELADKAGTSERYVREWLNAQAAGGYVEYDPASGRYTLPPEQALALTDADSPAYLPGFFQIALGSVLDSPASPRPCAPARASAGTTTATTCSRAVSGSSAPATTPTWSSRGCRRSTAWWPSWQQGASWPTSAAATARSTILMATAFPSSTFVGYDYHAGLDRAARERAAEAGVADRVRFEATPAAAYRGHGLRPGDHVRLPARHGRPDRRGPPRARDARARRHVR